MIKSKPASVNKRHSLLNMERFFLPFLCLILFAPNITMMTSSNESLVKDQLSSKCTNSAKDYFGSGNGGIYSDECQSGDALTPSDCKYYCPDEDWRDETCAHIKCIGDNVWKLTSGQIKCSQCYNEDGTLKWRGCCIPDYCCN